MSVPLKSNKLQVVVALSRDGQTEREGTIVWNCWTGALAHLGKARANALESRVEHGAGADAARVRALAAYKDFLTLWKDADPDIPILKQAKAEYSKLQ
jgi:eukaryotic-like serine/threonine-protein kinase